MHFGISFCNTSPHLGWSKNLTELVKPVELTNCFLGSEIEEVIPLNLEKKC